MVRLLLTGFEPFAHHKVNTSWQAAAYAGGLYPDITALELPVDYIGANEQLLEALQKYQPQSCLCMGLAQGKEFRLETQARKPQQLSHLSGQPLHQSSWPFQQMGRVLDQQDCNWRYSEDCGQYVCESTLWTLLQYQADTQALKHCAFLHLPNISQEYPLERINQTIAAIIEQYLAEV